MKNEKKDEKKLEFVGGRYERRWLWFITVDGASSYPVAVASEASS